MPIEPYLFFEGRAEEALEFYRKAIGAEVTMMMRYKDNPEPNPGASGISPEKIMHASFRVGDAQVMASDGMSSGKPNFQGFALSLPVRDEAEARQRFDALAEGGQVRMPLEKTFFSPSFGMVADKFGVTWMVIVPQQHG